jgi:hypothetical protein
MILFTGLRAKAATLSQLLQLYNSVICITPNLRITPHLH